MTKKKRTSRRKIDSPSPVRQARRFRRSRAMTDTPHRDAMQEFADRIVTELERGVKPWVRPWDPEKAGGPQAPFNPVTGKRLLEAAGQGTKMADHVSPIFRPAFPSSAIISERSSPSRVRFAAPNNGAPLTAPGRSGQHS